MSPGRRAARDHGERWDIARAGRTKSEGPSSRHRRIRAEWRPEMAGCLDQDTDAVPLATRSPVASDPAPARIILLSRRRAAIRGLTSGSRVRDPARLPARRAEVTARRSPPGWRDAERPVRPGSAPVGRSRPGGVAARRGHRGDHGGPDPPLSPRSRTPWPRRFGQGVPPGGPSRSRRGSAGRGGRARDIESSVSSRSFLLRRSSAATAGWASRSPAQRGGRGRRRRPNPPRSGVPRHAFPTGVSPRRADVHAAACRPRPR